MFSKKEKKVERLEWHRERLYLPRLRLACPPELKRKQMRISVASFLLIEDTKIFGALQFFSPRAKGHADEEELNLSVTHKVTKKLY